MSLTTITRSGPEISDAIVSFDPVTLQRKPVKKVDVLVQFRELGNHEAARIVEQIPEHEGVLDPTAVDKILITSHCEMQRMLALAWRAALYTSKTMPEGPEVRKYAD